MPYPLATAAARDSNRFVLGVALAIILMALVVLGGWHAHVPAAVQVFPGLIPMQYNSALVFLALGAAAIGLYRRLPGLIVAGGAFAAAMGAAVILEYLSGRSFGIDTFFFYPWLQTLSADPGRMALTTGISFFMVGGALLVLAFRPGAFAFAGIANAVPLSLALTSLIGYAFRITYVLPFSLGAQMALLTSLALLAYCTVMMMHAWQHAERGPDGAPRWSAGMGIALLPVLFVGWSSLLPGLSWQMLAAGGLLALAGVLAISFGIHVLATKRVAYQGLLLIAGPLILLLVFVGLVVRVRAQSEVAQARVLHTVEVVGVSEALLTRLSETQSAVRGFALTGDTASAEFARESAQRADAAAAALRRLVAGNPAQSARAAIIEQLTIRRSAQSARLIDLVEAGDQRRVVDGIRGTTGQATIAQVRVELSAFADEEARLGAGARAALDASWQELSWLLVAGTAGAILLSCMLALSFSSSVSFRLQRLRDNVRALAAGRALTSPLEGSDEIAELDRVFRELADSLYVATSREKAVIESTTDAILIKNLQHQYLMINAPAAQFIGRPIHEIIGASNEDLIEADTAQRIRVQDEAIIASGETISTEFSAVNLAGVTRTYHSTRSPYRDRAGAIIGLMAISRDVTEQRQAQELIKLEHERRMVEQMLRKKNVELEAASRMKSEFLANMSHELRTPLNAIIGFSEVLRDGLIGSLTDPQRGFISDIYGSGRHLLALINDILDLSKVEAGEMRLELEPVPVAALFSNSLAVVREKAVVSGIRLHADGGEATGTFVADGRKMKQIVYNLLANAVKFSAQGGSVVMRAARVPRAAVALIPPGSIGKTFALAPGSHEEFIEISITDRGIGISAAGLERLFKPFSQVDSGLARRFEGTGLGLVLVKQLVELHGGTVAVHSAEGQGSCFTVWVPARPIPSGSPALLATPDRPAFLPADARVALMVDDDLKSADLIRVQLEAEGFTVIHASSAEEAFALVIRRPPALITLDILLPDMDGWELLARIKSVPDMQRIPVVIISIVADPQRGFSLGAAAVLQKPMSRLELYETLADLALVPTSPDQRLTVLIVDDDPKAVELIAVRLIDVASRVLRCYGGAEAIELALAERPDVIVLDLMMPDVNGFDVVDELRRHPATVAIPIIVVTAKQLTEADRAQLRGFVVAILEKAQFSSEAFLAELRRALAGGHPRGGGA